MKQFNKRKISVVIALLMCMILAFGSTFAYLSATDNEINTVTIGKVEIDVVEDLWSQLPDTDGDGIPDAAEAVIPNQSVTKDPSIKNTGNNEAYVYLSVEVPNKNITSFNPDGTPANGGAATDTDLFNYEINDGWTLIGSKTEAGKTIYTYGYEEKLAVGAETPTLFDKVTVVNTSEGQGFEETVQDIVINGYAIQSDNVGDLLNAWNVINNQANLGTTAISNLLIPGPDFNATIPAAATKVAFVDDTAPAAYTFDNGKLLDVSDAQDEGVVSWYDEASTTYYVSTQRAGLDALINPNSSYMFSAKPNLKEFNFSFLDTKLSTDMSYMFYRSYNLAELNISTFNTSNVKTMEYMFGTDDKSNLMKLININFGDNFDTSKTENFARMFRNCANIEEINVSNWNLSSALITRQMFDQCKKLKTLDVSKWNLSSCKNFLAMFQGCEVIENINVTNWDVSSAENLAYVFAKCYKLDGLDVSKWNTSLCKNLSATFQYCLSIDELDLSNWDVSSCENLSAIFNHCENIKEINITGWNTSNVKDLHAMFQQCSKLETVDVSVLDLSLCENVSFMFYGCSSLKKIDINGWDVSKVTTFDHFMAHSKMEDYDVSNWNVTSACTNLNAIFHSTKETYIDVTGWDTSNVIAFNQLCDGMYYLEKIDGLETWNTSKGVCFGEMFNACGSLKEVNLSSFDTRNANEGTIISTNNSKSYGLCLMLSGCSSLQKITLSKNFTRFGNGLISSGNYAYFPTPSSGYWYNAETGQAYLPEEIPDLTAATYVSTQP